MKIVHGIICGRQKMHMLIAALLIFVSSVANAQPAQSQGGPTDIATFSINRLSNYDGGVPGFVNSALRVNNSVGAGVKAFEWSILGRIDSASLVSQSVGVYGQASAVAPGVQVWGSVSEARDDEGHNAILVGQEVDIVGGAKSIGIDLVAYNAPQNMTGIRIGPASGSNFPLDTGIAFKGAYATAAITVPAAGTQMTWIFMSEDKSVGLGIAVVGGQQRICIYSRQQCTIF